MVDLNSAIDRPRGVDTKILRLDQEIPYRSKA